MIKVIEKYKTVPAAARAALWFVFASMLQKAMAFITVPIFTRIMDTAQYGLYSTYLSWSSIFTVLLTLRLESGAYTNVLGKVQNREQQENITISFITLCFCVTTAAMLLVVLFPSFMTALTGLSTSMLVLMLLEIYFIPIVNFWSYRQRFEYKYRVMVIYTLIKSLVNVAVGIALVYLFPTDLQAYGRIISVLLVEGVTGCGLYFRFIMKTHKFFSFHNWTKTLRFQMPLIPHYLSMNLLFSSDRIMISKFIGNAEAGIYNVAYSAGQVMDILKMCLVDTVRPWVYEKLNQDEYSKISRFSFLLISVMTLISVAYASIAPEIIYVIAAPQYRSAIYVIPPVAMSSIFTFIYHFFMIIETYYEKTTKIMSASLLAAVANIALNLFMIPQFGFIAAGYTTLVSYFILSLFHYRVVRQIEMNELRGKNLFNIRQLSMLAAIGTISCVGVSFLYDYAMIRYGIILTFIALVCIGRKHALELYKMLKDI
nr:oligosaccharide flippase family protein [uncultured Acetatifactor sp.]